MADPRPGVRCRHRDGTPPTHVAAVITDRDLFEHDTYDTLEPVFEWTLEFDAEPITGAVSALDTAVIPTPDRPNARSGPEAPRCAPPGSPEHTGTTTSDRRNRTLTTVPKKAYEPYGASVGRNSDFQREVIFARQRGEDVT